jgi:Ran-binding protein 3
MPKKSEVETTAKLDGTTIPPVEKEDAGEVMQSQEPSAASRQDTPDDDFPDKDISGVASPKNKRTREQAEAGAEAVEAPAADSIEESAATTKPEDERTSKRPRDTFGFKGVADITESKVKVGIAHDDSFLS